MQMRQGKGNIGVHLLWNNEENVVEDRGEGIDEPLPRSKRHLSFGCISSQQRFEKVRQLSISLFPEDCNC